MRWGPSPPGPARVAITPVPGGDSPSQDEAHSTPRLGLCHGPVGKPHCPLPPHQVVEVVVG